MHAPARATLSEQLLVSPDGVAGEMPAGQLGLHPSRSGPHGFAAPFLATT